MKKKIDPITISYVAGQPKTAGWFEVYSNMDNLDSAANFQWALYENVVDSEGNDTVGGVVQSGALACEGQDYADWSTEPDANTWIINWAAEQLNITLVTV